jgi:hypothetical protein
VRCSEVNCPVAKTPPFERVEVTTMPFTKSSALVTAPSLKMLTAMYAQVDPISEI